jgi:hypothetical protein
MQFFGKPQTLLQRRLRLFAIAKNAGALRIKL